MFQTEPHLRTYREPVLVPVMLSDWELWENTTRWGWFQSDRTCQIIQKVCVTYRVVVSVVVHVFCCIFKAPELVLMQKTKKKHTINCSSFTCIIFVAF